jgi:hypothetical protein
MTVGDKIDGGKIPALASCVRFELGMVVDPGLSDRGPLGRPWASYRAEGKG